MGVNWGAGAGTTWPRRLTVAEKGKIVAKINISFYSLAFNVIVVYWYVFWVKESKSELKIKVHATYLQNVIE